MFISSWFPWRRARQHKGRSRPLPSPASRRRSAHLGLEYLEDRTVPSTLLVMNNLDSGPGSLRQAILDADSPAYPGPDTIVFANSVHHITLTSGELAITESLDIVGADAGKLTVSGNNASRVFDITSPTADVTISGLTITDGKADVNAPVRPTFGGGILNNGGLNLTDVVVSDNKAESAPSFVVERHNGSGAGGGVTNFGTLTVTGSTFIHNQALGANGSVGPFAFLSTPPNPGAINFPGLGIGGAS